MNPTRIRDYAIMLDAVAGAYNSAGLRVYGITPNVGPVGGGQAVTISGRNFRDITSVTLGGAALTSIVVVNEQTITGVTSARGPGLVDLVVNSSSVGTVTLLTCYTYVGGFGTGVNTLLLGKQIDPGFARQEFFTGEVAGLGVDTVLALTLDDVPIAPDAVQLYVRKVGDDGGILARQGILLDYTVDISTRKITWRGTTAAFALAAGDELTAVYLARGET
jgi:hypothetical protein